MKLLSERCTCSTWAQVVSCESCILRPAWSQANRGSNGAAMGVCTGEAGLVVLCHGCAGEHQPLVSITRLAVRSPSSLLERRQI